MPDAKLKCGCVPYGTECGPGCRCRVRSPLLCGTAPYYGTGARAEARIRTLVRIRISILKPGTASFLKLKCKNVHGSTQRWRGSVFLVKISCLNFFLKLLGVTRTRLRILGSGSVKKFIKTENANDSGSGRGLSMRYRECYALLPDQCHPGPASPKSSSLPCLLGLPYTFTITILR